MAMKRFVNDISQLRDQAKAQIRQGSVTNGYTADVKQVKKLLESALATEMICMLRYKNHYYKAKELGAKTAADEFLEHANQEQQHADKLANRLAQLGETPHFSPDGLSESSHAVYIECDNINEMVKENLIAERIAIDTYRAMIQYINNSDPTTRKMLEDILASEEEHADDLKELACEYDVNLKS